MELTPIVRRWVRRPERGRTRRRGRAPRRCRTGTACCTCPRVVTPAQQTGRTAADPTYDLRTAWHDGEPPGEVGARRHHLAGPILRARQQVQRLSRLPSGDRGTARSYKHEPMVGASRGPFPTLGGHQPAGATFARRRSRAARSLRPGPMGRQAGQVDRSAGTTCSDTRRTNRAGSPATYCRHRRRPST